LDDRYCEGCENKTFRWEDLVAVEFYWQHEIATAEPVKPLPKLYCLTSSKLKTRLRARGSKFQGTLVRRASHTKNATLVGTILRLHLQNPDYAMHGRRQGFPWLRARYDHPNRDGNGKGRKVGNPMAFTLFSGNPITKKCNPCGERP
jgi:hypothetical protein